MITCIGLKTASSVWAAIKSMFAAQSRTRIANLRVRLTNTKKEGKMTAQYFTAVKSLVDELAAVSRKIDADEQIKYLLAGLNDPYSPLFAVIGANPDAKLTVSELYLQVVAYDNHMEMLGVDLDIDVGKSSANAAAHGGCGGGGHGRGQNHPQHQGGGNGCRGRGGGNNGENHAEIVCQICNKPGHPAWRCWHRYSDDEEEEEERGANAASYSVGTNWYGDSGATDHIASELDKLTMKEKYNGRDKIHAANGAGMNISHIGYAFVDSPSKRLQLRNVLHIPHATKNLVSIHRLTLDNNVFVEFHPWYFYVKDRETKRVLLKGRCTKGLYPLVSSSSSKNKQVLSATKPLATRWHDRLGHPSFKVVQRVLRNYELPCSNKISIESVCDSCQRTKSHQLPYVRSTSVSTVPLELVFSNVWGKAPTSSGGFSYYVSFIYDFSKFSWIYLIKKKPEVFEVFQKFQNLVERKFDRKIIAMQTD
jgi:hypothetical protein